MPHKWTQDDDLLGYCLYRIGQNRYSTGLCIDDVCDATGISIASMNYKIGNYKHLDSQGGFAGFSKQARATYDQYCSLSDDEIIILGLNAMERLLARRLEALQAARALRKSDAS